MDRNWDRRRGKGHAQRRRLERKVKELEDRLSEAGRKRQREQQQHDMTPPNNPRALSDTDEREREQQQEFVPLPQEFVSSSSELLDTLENQYQDVAHRDIAAESVLLLQRLMRMSHECLKASAPHAIIPGIIPGVGTGQLDVDRQAGICDELAGVLKIQLSISETDTQRHKDVGQALQKQLALHKQPSTAQINALTHAQISSNQSATIERLEAELVAQSQQTTD